MTFHKCALTLYKTFYINNCAFKYEYMHDDITPDRNNDRKKLTFLHCCHGDAIFRIII